jgi:hypothetical protein
MGISGLVFLLSALVLLYLLVRNYNKYTADGEASRTKYIAVWILAGFFANVFDTVWSEVWVSSFQDSILNPQSNFMLFLSYYAILLAGIYYIFKFTYSFFTSIVRRKVIPYIWLGSILGILISIIKLSAVKISSLYPDFLTYNASALILSQLVFIGLTVRWIHRNPGLELASGEDEAVNNNQKEPKIIATNVKIAEIDADNGKILSKSNQVKPAADYSKAGERIEKLKATKDGYPSDQTSSEKPWPEATVETTTLSTDSNFDIAISESSFNRRQELCEHLYVASKFGDIEEILNLLSQLGFQVKRDQFRFIVKDNNDLKKEIDGDENLISFAKKLYLQ